MSRGYIAVDLGAESGRVIVGTLAEEKVALAEVHRFPHEPVELPTGLHWDVTGLWREISRGLKLAASWAREHQVQLVSVGVDTWGVDWALVGKSGELVALPHAYRDPRNQAIYEQVVEQLGEGTIYRTTGIQFMCLNTLYSLKAAHTYSPELFEAAESLLFMPDLLHFWLSGEQVVEATIASTSQMVDCRSQRWAENLLEPLGLPRNILGEISPPGTRVGTLRPALVAETGLPAELAVVAPGSHDTASAVAAAPASGTDSWCYLSSGTWSLLGAELAEPCVNEAAQAAMFTNELGVEGRTRFLKNIAGLWLVQECRRDFARQGEEFSYAELTDLALDCEPFRTLVDPGHVPFQTPGDMLEKVRAYARQTGQSEPDDPGQFVRSCLESLALAYRQTLELLESVLDRQFAVMHIIGGGGKNTLLNQMAADATERTVRVGPVEATALGNTLTQAIAAGDLEGLDHLRRVVAGSFELAEYEPSDVDAWRNAYERYLKLVGTKVS